MAETVFCVFTPFRFDDGDHITIVLKKKEQAGWVLSDEGHTYMHLTYDISEKKLFSGTRYQNYFQTPYPHLKLRIVLAS